MKPNLSPSLQQQSSSLDRLRKFSAAGYLYALLDAYETATVPGKAEELGKEKAVCLFIGNAERKYWDLAPYLMLVDESTLDWVWESVSNAPCGVLVLSKSNLETLRTHFRRFLTVQLPDGESWYFRYYDPRILKTYLENCQPDELEIFFGPVRGFGIVEPGSDRVLLLHTSAAERPIIESDVTSAWKIRPEQHHALEQTGWKDLEDRLVVHLMQLFPEHCRHLGPEELRSMIRYGGAKATTHHLYREVDLCRFVELMFPLGRNFDQIPEVASLLQDTSVADPSARLARVYEWARRRVTQV